MKVHPRKRKALHNSIQSKAFPKYNGIGFKRDRKPMKGVNQKNNKRPIIICIHYKIIGHLESFCFYKSKGYKGNHLRYFVTNVPGTKMIWVSKVKP